RVVTDESRLRTSVVAEKEDNSVIQDVIILERLQDLSDPVVQRHHHGCVVPAVRVGDIGNSLQIDVRRLVVWCMDRVVGQIEKERLGGMIVNKSDRFTGESISKVLSFDKRRV